jgi:hypothetical protein
MADDHAPIDCLTDPNKRLDAFARGNTGAGSNPSILRTMFAGTPSGDKGATKAMPKHETSQQIRPKASFLVPSL